MKKINKGTIEKFIRERFLTDGYEKLRMDEISKKLKCSKKTIYKYYSSKEQLYRNIILAELENSYKELVILIQADNPMFEKVNKLKEIIKNHIVFIADDSLTNIKSEFPRLWKEILFIRGDKVLTLINVLLTHSMKYFIISDYPNELIIRLFSSALALSGSKKTMIQNKGQYQQTFDMIFEILLNGILTKKGKKLLAINKRMKNEKD